MPRPSFVICSQSGADDKFSGLLSLFNVIDRIGVRQRIQNGAENVTSSFVPRLRVTATWLAEAADKSEVFEFETVALLPPNREEFRLGKGQFVFNKSFKRLVTRIFKPIPLEEGLLVIQSRIRKVGTTEWSMQEVPILVEKVVPHESQPAIRQGTS